MLLGSKFSSSHEFLIEYFKHVELHMQNRMLCFHSNTSFPGISNCSTIYPVSKGRNLDVIFFQFVANLCLQLHQIYQVLVTQVLIYLLLKYSYITNISTATFVDHIFFHLNFFSHLLRGSLDGTLETSSPTYHCKV